MPLYGAHSIPLVAKVEVWQQTKSEHGGVGIHSLPLSEK